MWSTLTIPLKSATITAMSLRRQTQLSLAVSVTLPTRLPRQLPMSLYLRALPKRVHAQLMTLSANLNMRLPLPQLAQSRVLSTRPPTRIRSLSQVLFLTAHLSSISMMSSRLWSVLLQQQWFSLLMICLTLHHRLSSSTRRRVTPLLTLQLQATALPLS